MHRKRTEGATPTLFVTTSLKEVSGLQPCRVFDQILHHSPMEACGFRSPGTTMASPVCAGTSACWQALSSTTESSSEKLQRGMNLAKPGTLRVSPSDDHIARIRTDYRDMGEMFFGEAPPFDRVIADLKELEARVNS